MKNKPGLRKGDPDSGLGDSNFSFHIIYKEIIRVYGDLPIYIMFQTSSVFLKSKKGEQGKQRYQCTKRWKEAQIQIFLITLASKRYMLSSALARQTEVHGSSTISHQWRHFYWSKRHRTRQK